LIKHSAILRYNASLNHGFLLGRRGNLRLTARGNVELGILTGNMEKTYWQFKKQTLEMIKPHILGFSFWNILEHSDSNHRRNVASLAISPCPVAAKWDVKLMNAKAILRPCHKDPRVTRGYGYGSIPINTIFRGMNIHLPAILM